MPGSLSHHPEGCVLRPGSLCHPGVPVPPFQSPHPTLGSLFPDPGVPVPPSQGPCAILGSLSHLGVPVPPSQGPLSLGSLCHPGVSVPLPRDPCPPIPVSLSPDPGVPVPPCCPCPPTPPHPGRHLGHTFTASRATVATATMATSSPHRAWKVFRWLRAVDRGGVSATPDLRVPQKGWRGHWGDKVGDTPWHAGVRTGSIWGEDTHGGGGHRWGQLLLLPATVPCPKGHPTRDSRCPQHIHQCHPHGLPFHLLPQFHFPLPGISI